MSAALEVTASMPWARKTAAISTRDAGRATVTTGVNDENS